MVDTLQSENITGENVKKEASDVIENINLLPNVNTPSPEQENQTCNDQNTSPEIPVQSNEQPEKLESEETSEDSEWLDILGSGDFKKKVVKTGSGIDSRPEQRSWVTASVVCRNRNEDYIIESNENLRFRLGDLDVAQGLDMAVALMELGEKAEILVPARLAYGKFGREELYIPADTDLKYEVELLSVEEHDDDSHLPLSERLRLGNFKRDQGNYWYGVGNYVNAIHCYQRAAEYLDSINGSDNPPEKLQEILDIRIKVNNNLAAAHLKMEAYDAALKSLNFVLKMQPSNVKAHFRKGKILATKGMTGEALTEMRTAAKLDPESKITQLELQKLQQKKKNEDNAQKVMYKRMFASNTSEAKSSTKRWYQSWSFLAGGMAAILAGVVAVYRQLH